MKSSICFNYTCLSKSKTIECLNASCVYFCPFATGLAYATVVSRLLGSPSFSTYQRISMVYSFQASSSNLERYICLTSAKAPKHQSNF